MICGICSCVKVGNRAGVVPFLFLSGGAVLIATVVFLLVRAALFSSESNSSSRLSVLELAACKC